MEHCRPRVVAGICLPRLCCESFRCTIAIYRKFYWMTMFFLFLEIITVTRYHQKVIVFGRFALFIRMYKKCITFKYPRIRMDVRICLHGDLDWTKIKMTIRYIIVYKVHIIIKLYIFYRLNKLKTYSSI